MPTSAPTVARRVAAELAGQGARAVVLVGSVARGDDLNTSDIDLIAVGTGGGEPSLTRVADRLVSVSWCTPEQVTELFADPRHAGGAVPAWRGARPLHDPDGIAAELRDRARYWRWEQIDARCDAWVAAELTGYAEEVYRLVGQLRRGGDRMAAVVRNVLANRMAMILAVHHRILYDSENRLWDLVADIEPEPWARVQDAALGRTAGYRESCRAALQLYVLAARRVRPLCASAQLAVIDAATELAVTECGEL